MMGWSIGEDTRWQRDIGYGVPATCDHPGCGARITRGLAYVCGEEPYGGEHGCGLFFCETHRETRRRGCQWVGLCVRCAHGDEPFDPTPDVPEWVSHKLTSESWARWRAENPREVRAMVEAVGGNITVHEAIARCEAEPLVALRPATAPRATARVDLAAHLALLAHAKRTLAARVEEPVDVASLRKLLALADPRVPTITPEPPTEQPTHAPDCVVSWRERAQVLEREVEALRAMIARVEAADRIHAETIADAFVDGEPTEYWVRAADIRRALEGS